MVLSYIIAPQLPRLDDGRLGRDGPKVVVEDPQSDDVQGHVQKLRLHVKHRLAVLCWVGGENRVGVEVVVRINCPLGVQNDAALHSSNQGGTSTGTATARHNSRSSTV